MMPTDRLCGTLNATLIRLNFSSCSDSDRDRDVVDLIPSLPNLLAHRFIWSDSVWRHRDTSDTLSMSSSSARHNCS